MNRSRNNRRKAAVFILIAVMFTFCSCGNNGPGSEPLSEYALGEWKGQFDMAKMMYKSLGDELGIELSPEPEYCNMNISFNDGNSCIISMDKEELAAAAGKCVEPYSSAILGFDTDMLVDIIMQYAVKDMPAESEMEECTYEVDDEQQLITVLDEDGDENVFYLLKDGSLQYEDQDLGQTVTLYKE